jgi:hypothetical protein
MKLKILALTALFAISVGFGALARAEDKAPAGDEAAKKSHVEMHEKMAEMHKKAAECLKSGKSEKECGEAMHAEMKKLHGDHDTCEHHCKGGKCDKGGDCSHKCDHDCKDSKNCPMKDKKGKHEHGKKHDEKSEDKAE